MDKLIETLEVANLFGESNDWVYTMAREGILPCVRVGRKVKFSQKAIEEFIRNGGKALPGGWRREA